MHDLTTEREYHFEHAGFQCEVRQRKRSRARRQRMYELTTEREYHFEHAGFQCEVRIMTCRAFPDWHCGYVSIPDGHPWHGKSYWHIYADVHGGLTYGQWCDGRWVIGFDTNHYGDGPKERSFEYCVEETRRLATQAAQAAQGEEAAKQ